MFQGAIREFKTFAMRGNVIDLAVGVVIGAAFTGIVNSLVNDILMPPLGLALGNVDFKDYYFVMSGDGPYTNLAAAKAAGAVTLNYGLFINALFQFVIVAIALFIIVKQVNRLTGVKPPPPGVPTPPPDDIVLLREIRDLLKTRV